MKALQGEFGAAQDHLGARQVEIPLPRRAWERLLRFSKSSDERMNQQVPVGAWTRTRLRNMGANDRVRRESGTRLQVGRRIVAFPEWMREFFIRLFTHQGDVVLDPFLGSGTTFRVARALGRQAVGIDRDCLDRFLESMQDEALAEPLRNLCSSRCSGGRASRLPSEDTSPIDTNPRPRTELGGGCLEGPLEEPLRSAKIN